MMAQQLITAFGHFNFQERVLISDDTSDQGKISKEKSKDNKAADLQKNIRRV